MPSPDLQHFDYKPVWLQKQLKEPKSQIYIKSVKSKTEKRELTDLQVTIIKDAINEQIHLNPKKDHNLRITILENEGQFSFGFFPE